MADHLSGEALALLERCYYFVVLRRNSNAIFFKGLNSGNEKAVEVKFAADLSPTMSGMENFLKVHW